LYTYIIFKTDLYILEKEKKKFVKEERWNMCPDLSGKKFLSGKGGINGEIGKLRM